MKILSATLAGKRMVAVGDHGVILLSDDNGVTFRQAKSVPVSSTLTSVTFSDPQRGWAVGHWGAIIRTTDGGENWTLQRSDTKADQPLFSVYFRNSTEGWAVGLWSLMLHTTDGGATWSKLTLSPPGAKKLDRNLYSIFGDRHDNLFIACEQGSIARSTDGGQTWNFVDTGYTGSFWTGLALQDGTLLVAGLRGTVYRSTDGGDTWVRSRTMVRSSVTDMVQMPDMSVIAVGLDGAFSFSKDDGVSFAGKQRTDRTALTAVVDGHDGRIVLFSANGPASP
ncbi:WD40/YVTN/BNR-like repeat-containing protein [Paraburkholderia caffeinilytica]|uniref:WD40/YVTN/BNR-like repeat-containing protein n=1 Tax=Paraburkholderia caffeinilytica TaxID=1761016 RepID=UPI0038BA0818